MTDPRRFTRATFVLIFAAFVVYLVGNANVPLWDRDEPRYAQCSRQMLETGDWVLPRYLDDLRMAKPPLIYWLQASSMSVFGQNEFAARLPSAIGMALTLLLLAVVVRRALSPEHAFWSVLVLGTSAMAIISAKASLTDAVLLFFITVGQICLYMMWVGRATWPVVCTFALAIGLALLTKGPVALGIHATTLVGYGLLTWSLRWRKPAGDPAVDESAPGEPENPDAPPAGRRSVGRAIAKVGAAVAIVLAVCLPWVVMVEKRWAELPPEVRAEAAAKGSERKRDSRPTELQLAAARGEVGYIWTTLKLEVIDRSKTGQEGHTGPPGYYLATIWGTFLPWSLILPATVVLAWQRRRHVHVRFALGAVLGPWLMFEAVQTKLPHYMLPCFVPLAILSADAIVQCLRHGSAALSDRPFRWGAVVWAGILALLSLVPWTAAYIFWPQPWAVLALLTLVTVAYGAFVARSFWTGETQRALAMMGVGALLLFGFIFRVYLPSCDYLRLAQQTAGVLREQGATDRGEAFMLDYKEPSLAFYQGGSIREHSATVVTPKLLETTSPAEWFVITREVWDRSAPKDPAQPDAREKLDVVATFRGLDVADGMRDVEVMVVRRKSAERVTAAE